MFPLFSKPLRAITPEDIERLITDAYPEGDGFELKQELPATGSGAADPWMSGGPNIGDRARNALLDEITAFANGHGGHIILGIAETTDKPARAERISAVPRCIDLADRLRLQVRDCIEPQLPVVDVAGVVTAPDGAGVVVVRIPQSRSAPHRVKQTLNCCIRRSDRCEKMTMREIQDLTLHRDRSLEKIESIFEKRKREFERVVSSLGNALGIRCTLLPIGSEIYIDRVHNNKDVMPFFEDVAYSSGTSTSSIGYPFSLLRPRPILRGTQYLSDSGDFSVKKEIHCNGLIEFSIFHTGGESENLVIFPEWFLGLAANSMFTAHRFRCAAGARECEYGIELELFRNGGPILVSGYKDRSLFPTRGALEPNPLIFPRFSMGTSSEISRLAKMVRVDFYDSAGMNRHDEVFELSIPEEILD